MAKDDLNRLSEKPNIHVYVVEEDRLLEGLKQIGQSLTELLHITQEDIDRACEEAREICWDDEKFAAWEKKTREFLDQFKV